MAEMEINQMPRRKKKGEPSGGKKEWTYKEWYRINREKVAERRRLRYHGDKKYREKVLVQNKEYRDRKAKESPKKKKKTKVRIPKHRKPVKLSIEIHGDKVEAVLVHIGAFSRSIGRSVSTVYQWERLGLLPRTPYNLEGKSKRERLYTADQIDVVKDAMARRNNVVSSSDPTFFDEIVDSWRAVGTVVEGK